MKKKIIVGIVYLTTALLTAAVMATTIRLGFMWFNWITSAL